MPRLPPPSLGMIFDSGKRHLAIEIAARKGTKSTFVDSERADRMRSWKTTLAGLATGALVLGGAVQDYVTSHNSFSLKSFGISIGLAVLGWLAADSKKDR